jgi:hypothetical protein
MSYPPPPPHRASDEEWLKWVNDVCPYQCREYSGPYELRFLTTIDEHQRPLAAQSARLFFARQSKRERRDPPKQFNLGFGDDD